MFVLVTVRLLPDPNTVEVINSAGGKVTVTPPDPLPQPNEGVVDAAALGTWLQAVLVPKSVDALVPNRRKLWIRISGDPAYASVAAGLALPWARARLANTRVFLEQDERALVSVHNTGRAAATVKMFETPGNVLLLGDDTWKDHLTRLAKIARGRPGWAATVATTAEAAAQHLEAGGWRVIYGVGIQSAHEGAWHLALGAHTLALIDHVAGHGTPSLIVLNGGLAADPPASSIDQAHLLEPLLARAPWVVAQSARGVTAPHARAWGEKLLDRVLTEGCIPVDAAFRAAHEVPGFTIAPLVWERSQHWDDGGRTHYLSLNPSRSDLLGHALQLDREAQWGAIQRLRRNRSALVLGHGTVRQSVHRFFERLARQLDDQARALAVRPRAHDGQLELLGAIAQADGRSGRAAPQLVREALDEYGLRVRVLESGTLRFVDGAPADATAGVLDSIERALAQPTLAEAIRGAPHGLQLFVLVEHQGPESRAVATAALARLARTLLDGPCAAEMELVELEEFALPTREHMDKFLDAVSASHKERKLVHRFADQLRQNPDYTFDHLLQDIELALAQDP